VIDFGKREVVGAAGNRIDVLNGVEDGDHVANTGDETNGHLGQHSLGNVTARLRDLLSQVRRTVRGTDGVGTVQHAHDKDEALLRVVGPVGPLLPDIVVGAIPDAVDVGHYGADDDGDEDTGQNEEHADVANVRQEAVHEKHDAAAEPGAKKQRNEGVPGLRHEARMHQRVHGYNLLGHNQGHGGSTQNPGETIPPASKETTDPTVPAGGNGGPVIHTTGRGHTRCQLGDGRGDQPVADRHGDAAKGKLDTIRADTDMKGFTIQFIDTTGKTTVTQCRHHTTTLCDPRVSGRDGHGTDTKKTEVALELLTVTGSID